MIWLGFRAFFFFFSLFALFTSFFFRHVKEWASQSKGCFPANKTLPKLTICSNLGAEEVEQYIKAAPATFPCLVSVEVAPSHLMSNMVLKPQCEPSQQEEKRRLHLLMISTLSAGIQCAGMYETPTGNRWLKNVIEYTRGERCRGVKYESQRDPPVQSIGKQRGMILCDLTMLASAV